MVFRVKNWRVPCALLLTALMIGGCSVPTADTGPTEEPNIGPGGPAGAPQKSKGAAETKKTTKPAAPPAKSASQK